MERLDLAWVTRGEHAFHSLNVFGLTNTGDVPCTLRGFPTIGLYDSAGHSIQAMIEYQEGVDWPEVAFATVTIAPQHVAGLYIEGIANPNPPGCVPLRNVTLRLSLPSQGGNGGTLSSRITPGICSGGNLYVSPIVPSVDMPTVP